MSTVQMLWIRDHQGPKVRALRKALAAAMGDDAAEYPGLVTAGAAGQVFDANTEAAARRWQSGVGLVADGVIGPYALALLGLRQPGSMPVALTLEAVRQLFPATKPANIQRYLPYVAAALDACGLRDRAMLCAALGTIRAESEGFLPISEMPSQLNSLPGQGAFSAYEGLKALGNTEAGDGACYKGRGFVQLTGRGNYTRYGTALGIDLALLPDLANAPEVAALLLAQVLADQQDAMRLAVAAGDLTKARKLVDIDGHGLDRFSSVFTAAETVWPEAAPESASEPAVRGAARGTSTTAKAKGKGKAKAKASLAAGTAAPAKSRASARKLTAGKDPADLRDRNYQPPPVSLQDAFPSDDEIRQFLPGYTSAKLILDQGSEGACTGFGLACVVNYLRWRKASARPPMASVSPRMLYHFARRHDEYAGDDYDGSSCRGALKGWFRNGVCLEQDWPYSDAHGQPRYGYVQRAAQHTLGVYYRLELGSISDVQAAIQEVGAVYVSAYTHAGWNDLTWPEPAATKGRRRTASKPAAKAATNAATKAATRAAALPTGHADLPLVSFTGRPSKTDGHAFALVGFNAQGFIVQNSWGPAWGLGGFAVLSYADWLANAMDAWVVAMGVPGVVAGRVSAVALRRGGAARGGADQSQWWSKDLAYRHSVVLGNDGRIKRYLTEDEFSRTLLHQVAVLPDAWFRNQPAAEPKRLLIFAHGGLNSEADAIDRARAMGRHFMGNGCYPLFMVWKTGLLESIGQIFDDARRREPPRAGAGLGEWLSERSDLLIEKTIGRHAARPIWSEMKENAELGFGNGRGGDLMITALQKLVDTWGEQLQIHLVGHSAGSILLGHLLSATARRGLPQQHLASVHLYAPACTVQFANQHYAAQPALMKRLHLDLLSDRVERNDNVVTIYRKSLLYMVSNALEVDLRTPLLGMANVLDPDYAGWDGTSSVSAALRQWRASLDSASLAVGHGIDLHDRDKVFNAVGANGSPLQQISAAHGSFDNDVEVIGATLQRILGGTLRQPVDDLRGF